MRILALDSSGLVASVAILEEETLLAEYTINHKKTHSQTLMPMLETMKELAAILERKQAEFEQQMHDQQDFSEGEFDQMNEEIMRQMEEIQRQMQNNNYSGAGAD